MRWICLILLFVGCQSTGGAKGGEGDAVQPGTDGAAGKTAATGEKSGADAPTGKVTRIVQREYRTGSTIFIMENEAGRDIKKLRSVVLREGQSPVSYVPDDVMDRLLLEFRKAGFKKYSQARPANPIQFGAIGEVTVIDENRKMQTILRIPMRGAGDKKHLATTKSYVDCKQNFLAVYNFFKPQMQATTKVDFGVRRTDYRR